MAATVVKYRDVENAIFGGIGKSRELRRAFDRFVDDVHRTWLMVWRSSMQGVLAEQTGVPHPYADGDYEQSVQKRQLSLRQRMFIKSTLMRGIPIGVVFSDDWKAHWVEWGTGPDKPGSHSPWGPDTPTPAFEPMTRTRRIMNGENEVV